MTSAQLQALLDESNCASCYVGASVVQLIKLALLDRVSKLYPAYSFIQRAGITDATQIAAINELVLSAKEHGWWDKCDLIYPFVGGTAGAHAQNLKSSNFTITWNGAVTHDANGITGDGVTGYGNTTYNPSVNALFGLNSCHCSLYLRSNPSNTFFGCRESSSRRIIFATSTGTNMQIALNSSLATAALLPSGPMVSSRTNTSNFRLLAQTLSTVAFPSTSVPIYSFFVLAFNLTGSPAGFSAANLSACSVGAGLDDSEMQLMAADWQTFQTALGRQV